MMQLMAFYVTEDKPDNFATVHRNDGPYPVPQPKPESTEGGPWGQPLKKREGAPMNLG